jgi:zinc/manganese transport system substrate-binding protein
MNSRVFFLFLCLLTTNVQADFRVFACEPEWANLVQSVMPDAKVTTATSAWQDPHYIEARPSLIAAMRNSDLAVCTGASLEAGWLPALIRRAATANIGENREGLFYAASHAHLHQPHQHVDRSMGDVHPEGNPHFHLDPNTVPSIMKALIQRISQVAPEEDTAFLEAQHLRWKMKWRQASEQWASYLPRLQGMKVVVQHSGFDYLLRHAGVEAVLDLEPKPGLPPTPSHLNRVLNDRRLQEAKVIVISPYQDPQPAKWLSGKSGIPVVTLPTTVTDMDETSSLPDLITYILSSLASYNSAGTALSDVKGSKASRHENDVE